MSFIVTDKYSKFYMEGLTAWGQGTRSRAHIRGDSLRK